MFGRSDDEWDLLLDNAITILKEDARRRRITSYGELNIELVVQTGEPAFDFSLERDRTAMGKILGQVVKATRDECGAMLSSIVVYIDRNDAGPGFYKFAMELGLLPPSATSDDKLAFWSQQVARVHDYYAQPPRRRRHT